ncbi:DUF2017 family protein [Oerskovia enterophila]
MRPFRRARRGYVAELSAAERLVLAHVVGDVVELLQEQAGPGSEEAAPPSEAATIEGVAPLSAPPEEVRAPTDPAVRRLLPDAAPEDAGVSAEFRRFTQGDLAAEKSQRLLLLADLLLAGDPQDAEVLTPLVVRPDDARRVAGALTDVRVVLAERLDLRTDDQVEDLHDEVLAREAVDVEEDEGAPDAARRFLASVFLMSGWLQESLVDLMLAEVRRPPR